MMSLTWFETLLCCVLGLTTTVHAIERRYYIAAVEEVWDYAPGGGDNVVYNGSESMAQDSDWRVFLQSGPDRIGRRYKKAMYREYTDATFTIQKSRHDQPWLGLLGPIIAAEYDDVIRITFKNMASGNFSMHPHGAQYSKDSEGALYQDGTSGSDKADDHVGPGQVHEYVWNITKSAAPTDDDGDCLTWVYHSHVNTVRDTNSGLIGILLTCKPGTLATLQKRYKQFALLLTVMDENQSWYLEENIHNFCQDPNSVDPEDEDFQESNLMHSINGRVFGHLEGLEACVGSTVLWHLVGFGTEVDIHSLSISGHSFLTSQHRQDAIILNPVDFVTATMKVGVAGRWLVTCNIYDHIKAGMVTFLDAKLCPDSGDSTLAYKIQAFRQHYIAIDEVDWDYAPGGQNKFEGGNLTQPGSPSEVFFKRDSQHVGGVYRKALYREYDDITFTRLKERTAEEAHLGFLGPVLRAEVGDALSVTLKNNAHQPFSIHPHGAVFIKLWEGALYKDGGQVGPDDYVMHGAVVTSYWFIPEDMGPGPMDPPCIVRVYTSSSRDTVRDGYSGLVGPILVCRRGALDQNGKQRQIDREFFLMFSVTDENKSWYNDYNFRSLTGIDRDDEDFQESNLMHGINGYLYGTLPGLEMCEGDRVMWHVFSIGTEVDIHGVYIHGQPLTILDTHRSATAVLPGHFKTVFMKAVNPGQWAAVCRTNDHYEAGTKALFNVRDCGYRRDYNLVPQGGGRHRTYYIQAEEEYWDYASSGEDKILGRNLSDPNHEGNIFIRSDGPYLGKRYKKVRYHQYTDASFSTRVQRGADQQYLGILGPVITMAAFDTVTVVFRNAASRPYSVHAQGLFYGKNSEGAPYAGGSGAVDPGNQTEYTWSVPVDFAPAEGDPPCITQAYYSNVDPVRDTNSGLIGPLVVCKPGVVDEQGRRSDVDKWFVLLFEVLDENHSWYLDDNIREFGNGASLDDPDFEESNLMHNINGYLYGNNPPINMTQNDLVDWHLMSLGTEVDIHSVHFHGNTISVYEAGVHTRDVTQLFPGVFRTVSMNTTMVGTWLLHCHVHDHLSAGMETVYTVSEPPVQADPVDPFDFIAPN